MSLHLILLFFVFGCTVKSQTTMSSTAHPTAATSAAPSSTTQVPMSSVQLVAIPWYPVAAGQTVRLSCSAVHVPRAVNWTWQHWRDEAWTEVATGQELSLTKPEESGLYQCSAVTPYQRSVSNNHRVFIIAMETTVGESLGITAFVFSLLALIAIAAMFFWLLHQRNFGTPTTSNATGGKGGGKVFPGPETVSKGGFPQADSDGDVYMNYTSSNRDYSDLDPANMTGDNVYSTLS